MILTNHLPDFVLPLQLSIQTTESLQNKVGEVVNRPKALGDIRGVTYIYGMFYRFGLIDMPDEVKEKMGHPKDRKK